VLCSSYAWFAGLAIVLVAIDWLMWLAFERRTEVVRKWLGG
jgi:hypothetical protein